MPTTCQKEGNITNGKSSKLESTQEVLQHISINASR
jgi:hypothetical protein